jgi:hypothetical protein
LINDDDCKNFINEMLAKYKVAKELDSLDKVLSRTVFEYYNKSQSSFDLSAANYTDTQLGVDMESVILLRAAFMKRGASAVTVRYQGIGHVFLTDDVFSRSDHYWGSNIADTPVFIVHELFHVAGIDQAVVDSQQMTNAITQHCHLVGANQVILSH